ncbi:MAG: hypothetical protein KDB07_04645, partial [Planctomycetes bacterium]|nr:hypothetical protein [Planctomycetota bacterium]
LLMAVLPNTLQAQNNEQPDPAPNNDGAQLITIHTNSIKLDLMFQLVSAHTGYRFIINDQVATQLESSVKIIAANGLTFPRDAAFNVLQALLKQRDQPLILMPFGDDTPTSVRFYEVVQVANAIQSMRDEDVIILDDIADFQDVGAGYVTLVAKLKHMRPTDMQNALRAFSTTQTSLRGVQPVGQNMILIADYASNVRRIGKMISLLDSAGSAPRLDVVHVRHMDAVELATAVEELITERVALIGQLDGNAGPQRLSSDAEAVSITIAPNSHSLIIQGLDAGIERVRALVERLDVKIPGIETTRGRIHRYKVKNVLASELQATLTALVGQNLEFRTTDGQLPGPGEEPVPTLPIGSSSFSDFPPVIEFDDNTQQLLIIAKPSDYVELLRVIEALDVRRPQAMIEAAILEVRKDNDFTFGAEVAFIEGSGSGTRVNGGTVFGFSDIVDEAGVPINTGGGEPVGRSPIFGTGGILTFNSGGPFDIPLLLRFLQSQSDVNVLSVPRVMANDNEQAVIAIETDVATLSSNSDGGVVGQNFDYETDGITLTVTPQISDDNYVTLEIDLD